MRGALDPHRDDLIGLVVVVAGVLLGLAVYLRVAGPVGSGIDTGLGALVGVGRYVLPVALLACGVALLLDGRSEHRLRLALGVGLATVALLGLLHLAKGPHEIAGTPSEVEGAGGWLGAVVGEPARQLIAPAGAVVVLGAVLLAGVLIASRSSLRRIAASMGRGVTTGAAPAFRKAKKAVLDMSTLSSAKGTVVDADGVEIASGPALYDFAERGAGGAGRGPQARTAAAATAGARDARRRGRQRAAGDRSSARARRRAGGSSRRPRSSPAPTPWRSTGARSRPAAGCSRTRWPAMASRPASSA